MMIKAIEIEIGKKTIRLTPEESQELYRELKQLHEQEARCIHWYPQSPIFNPPISIPGYPWKYGTWSTAGSVTVGCDTSGNITATNGTTDVVNITDKTNWFTLGGQPLQ